MPAHTSLRQKNLSQIIKSVSIPTYDRGNLTTGIVHIGVGGFHRAHQAYYIHQLMENGEAHNWGICGVGLRQADREIYHILTKQDYLYSLIVRYPNGKIDTHIIGSMTEYLLGADEPQRVIDKMTHPDTKIVSLTITEGGYNFDPSTGEFDFEHPDIQSEINHSDSPKTIYGFLTAALKKRQEAGLAAFTVLSCDNIQHNGEVVRKMLLAFVRKQDEALAEWIAQEVAFPNTMVDRITPATTPTDIDYLRDILGVVDEWPVTCEPFTQWVIEDKFSNGRPELEKVGVQFVPDVSPYEKMKIRLLNAGHSVLGVLGAIHGHATIDVCMEDSILAAYLRKFWDEEANPILDELEGIDVKRYKDQLEERFGNPNVKDGVSRICSESSAKLPKFLIPTIRENLAVGGSITYATSVIAAWCYYHDKQIDNNQQPINIIDTKHEELQLAAQKTAVDPLAFLRQPSIFGNLILNERFTRLYTEMIQQLYTKPNIRDFMQHML